MILSVNHYTTEGRSLALNIRFGGQRRRALRPSLSEVNVSEREQHFPSLMSQHPAVSKTVPTPAGILSPASNQPVWGQSVNTSAPQDPRQALCMMAQILKQFL
nr:hypothetical protein BaRGS_025779 [Batillaria attramentaria]